MIGHAAIDVDFVVVGGGPAGSVCALKLVQAGARVGLFEASDYSQFRVGETLEPSLGPTLQQIGIDLGAQAWAQPCHGVMAAWGQATPARRATIFNPHGRGWRVDRRKFDRALFERARDCGVEALMQTRLVSPVREAGAWTFQLRSGEELRSGRARWLVAATGRRASLPAASAKTRMWLDSLVGVAFVHSNPPEERDASRDYATVEATPHGWWYSVCAPGGRRIAIFFTDADLLPRRGEDRKAFLRTELGQCALAGSAGGLIADMVEQRRWLGFDARSGIVPLVMSDGWAAVGDAVMAFDPLCGRGVSAAIGSAIEVAASLLETRAPRPADDELPAWVSAAANRFNSFLKERRQTYAAETRWPRSPFWSRRGAA